MGGRRCPEGIESPETKKQKIIWFYNSKKSDDCLKCYIYFHETRPSTRFLTISPYRAKKLVIYGLIKIIKNYHFIFYD